jgi:cytochrome P450
VAYVEKALRFNPASPVFQENLHNVYHHMRNHQPVARIGKTWVLTRYQDVYQTLKERAFVSSGIPEDVHSEMEKECFSLSPPYAIFSTALCCLKTGMCIARTVRRCKLCLPANPGLR